MTVYRSKRFAAPNANRPAVARPRLEKKETAQESEKSLFKAQEANSMATIPADELYNILCNDMRALILLDCEFRIRRFFPSTMPIFNLLPGDIGRHVSDFRALVDDSELLNDAQNVVASGVPSEAEVSASNGQRFIRRLTASRHRDNSPSGVVITYFEVTNIREMEREVEESRSEVERLKWNYRELLESTSHDSRNNLQNLRIIGDQLREVVLAADLQRLVSRFDAFISAMTVHIDELRPLDRSSAGMVAPLAKDSGFEDCAISEDARATDGPHEDGFGCRGLILVVEDEPDLRGLLGDILRDAGFYVLAAANAEAALELADHTAIAPDVMLIDYNLPGDIDGLTLSKALCARLQCEIPLVVLTGDVSDVATMALEAEGCVRLIKPVGTGELIQYLANAVMSDKAAPEAHLRKRSGKTICVVDNDHHARALLQAMLEGEGYHVAVFEDAESFLAAGLDSASLCLLLDLKLPGIGGIELLTRMHADGTLTPAVVLTAVQDPQEAVGALKAGAMDFLLKPVPSTVLLESIDRVVDQAVSGEKSAQTSRQAQCLIGQLTDRQRDVMSLILAGNPNKIIAAKLGVSQRTVENHRAAIMHRTGARSLPELARLSVAAGIVAAV